MYIHIHPHLYPPPPGKDTGGGVTKQRTLVCAGRLVRARVRARARASTRARALAGSAAEAWDLDAQLGQQRLQQQQQLVGDGDAELGVHLGQRPARPSAAS